MSNTTSEKKSFMRRPITLPHAALAVWWIVWVAAFIYPAITLSPIWAAGPALLLIVSMLVAADRFLDNQSFGQAVASWWNDMRRTSVGWLVIASISLTVVLVAIVKLS